MQVIAISVKRLSGITFATKTWLSMQKRSETLFCILNEFPVALETGLAVLNKGLYDCTVPGQKNSLKPADL